ncbi:MAG TPA: rhodanese-like domain-containing protein, partial [Streptosporangiaceae bacterium]
HLAYLLADGSDVLAVFSGGSLLVGSAARTDLAGPDHTELLARAQFASLRRLMTLPDATAVYPTHGAGSFCSAPPGAERTTTIGRERAANPLLAAPDEAVFSRRLLDSLGSFPPYFLRLAAQNRSGPAVVTGDPALPALTPPAVARQLGDGAMAIDVRPVQAYARGHIPGSLAIALRPAFATWLGWLVPDPATPLVLVAEPGQDLADAAWQAAKIGYENLAGALDGGIRAWQEAGHQVTVTPLVTAEQVDPCRVLDVRQASEYSAGHLPSARNIELGRLPEAAGGLDGGPVVTMCGHGERAATAASVLERAGLTGTAIFPGGPENWTQVTGHALEAGE